ncbi:hypothetical protein AVEN_135994-1 [Araneus ventricosus]|uniref:Tc1-like transposase DDE domain-containing protein n=1 Tax=Araneus ventricosus TaxID=182803 RepID=A0A4Y2LDC8_ARAVE|nr:hypothetical protein AVEN_135994-1 [Araneus ventricosus]
MLIYNNACPHRVILVDEYILRQALERMDWPNRLSALNTNEHTWDCLGREQAAQNVHPRVVHELVESFSSAMAFSSHSGDGHFNSKYVKVMPSAHFC